MMRRREFLASSVGGAAAWASGCGTRSPGPRREEPRIVRLSEEDGAYWLLDADGNRFFALGTPLPESARYREETPEAAEGVNTALDELESQGFNMLDGTGTTPSPLFRERIHFLSRPEGLRRDSLPEALSRPNEFHPDLYDPTYYGEARWVGRLAAYYGYGAEKVVGYTLGESPDWRLPEDQSMHPWVEAMRSFDEGTPGKRRWVEGLRERYESPLRAAAVYGTADATWEALARRTDWPEIAVPESASDDDALLLRAMAERWYQTRTESVRGFDRRGTLVLSDLVDLLAMPDWLSPILAEYVDVLYLRCPANDDAAAPKLEAVFEATGKPVLVAQSVADAQTYAQELGRLASLPFVLGRIEHGDLDRSDPRVAESNGKAAERHGDSGRRLP